MQSCRIGVVAMASLVVVLCWSRAARADFGGSMRWVSVGGNLGLSNHGGEAHGLLGAEVSVGGLQALFWGGAYLDTLYDFGTERVRCSLGPELGILFLGLDGGLQDDTVTCGDGGSVKEGDTCNSVSGLYEEAGILSLGSGLTFILAGVLADTRDPTVEKKPLPTERRVTLAPAVHPCGTLSDLEGTVVTASLSDGGRWSGKVDAQGAVQIALGPSLGVENGMRARFSVESAPERARQFVSSGLTLGELPLVAPSRKTEPKRR